VKGIDFMKLEKVFVLKEILTEQMNHWFLFPLILTVGFNLGEAPLPNLLMWIFCSVFPLFFFWLRRRLTKSPAFFLSHIIIIALSVIALCQFHSFGGGIYALYVTGHALYSLLLRLTKTQPYSGAIHMIVGVVISVFAGIMLQNKLESRITYYAFSLIAAMILSFFTLYIQQYLDFLSTNKSSAGHLPASEMFRSGMELVAGYTFLGAAIMVISTHFKWFSDALQWIKDFLIKLLRRFFSSIVGETKQDMIPQGEDNLTDVLDTLPKTEPFWLWEVLGLIVELVFVLFLFLMMATLLWKFFRWLYSLLASRERAEDLPEDGALDIREKCDMETHTGRPKRDLRGAFSFRERIRRLYKKKLLISSSQMSEQERTHLNYYTAREWEEKLRTDGMAGVYEMARYSEHEMTAEDLKKMKEACNGSRQIT